jgi:hypothetical protein
LEPDPTAVLLAGKDTRAAACLDVESGDRFGRYWFVIKLSILYILHREAWSQIKLRCFLQERRRELLPVLM